MTIKQVLHRLNRRDTRLLPKDLTLSKIILISLAVFAVTFTTKAIFAETTNTGAEFIRQKQDAIQKGNNQEAWIDSALGSNVMSLQIALSGTFPESFLTGDIVSYKPGGMVGASNQMIAATFNPMASGIEYIAQVKNNFLGKPAYAANETGFQGLRSIMSLWKVFRNVVYVLISLIFITIGIMIMLRIKISAQATVSIQSSIPRIITTLILVTFSYAIAGLCIDLINLFQSFAIALLFTGLGKGYSEGLFPLSWSNISIQNLIDAIRALFGDNPFNFNNLNNLNFWGVVSLVQRLAPNGVLALLGGVIGAVIGSHIVPGVGTFIGGGIGALGITLILTIIIFIYLIKFGFGLAKCYITALLKIIFAPFELLLGALPNSKIGFSSWIISIFANLAVFPVSVIFLIIANILVDSVGGVNPLWAPTLVQGPYVWFLPAMIGITAVALLSKLPTIIPEAIFKIKPSPYGKAIGEGFKSIPGVGLAAAGARLGGKFGMSQGGKYIENLGYDHNESGERTGKVEGRKAAFRRTVGKVMSFASESKH